MDRNIEFPRYSQWPINDIEGVVNDPQILSRQMIVDIEHPTVGNMKMAGVPIKMSETQGSIRFAAPLLGEHTDEILKNMGNLTDSEIENLRVKGGI